MKKVIIADDEPYVLRLMKMALERQGFEVKTACNGEEAYDILAKEPPDLLITDVQMPKMTGQELCQKIEHSMPERKFLIFVLTSRTELEHRDWTADISNIMFMEKPVSIQKLISRINEYKDGGEVTQ